MHRSKLQCGFTAKVNFHNDNYDEQWQTRTAGYAFDKYILANCNGCIRMLLFYNEIRNLYFFNRKNIFSDMDISYNT